MDSNTHNSKYNTPQTLLRLLDWNFYIEYNTDSWLETWQMVSNVCNRVTDISEPILYEDMASFL